MARSAARHRGEATSCQFGASNGRQNVMIEIGMALALYRGMSG